MEAYLSCVSGLWKDEEIHECIHVAPAHAVFMWQVLNVQLNCNQFIILFDSGCRFASMPSFLKIYLSTTCNLTVIHYKCIVGCIVFI